MTLAIFDLDHTLLAGDSDHAWGQFLIDKEVVDAASYREANERYYAQYRAGTLDIFEFLEFALKPLTRHDRAQLDAWHREFLSTHIRPMITPAARALVEDHRRQGHTLMIITATNRFVTGPIAREFAIDHLLATDPEEADGRFTGRVAGVPCYREGKVARLREWLNLHHESLAGSWFYSDSHNDLPLLELVDHPVAVNPDDVLRREAGVRHWSIQSLA
jgi:HAD superfamily hydrolase (TIGR01490 family)